MKTKYRENMDSIDECIEEIEAQLKITRKVEETISLPSAMKEYVEFTEWLLKTLEGCNIYRQMLEKENKLMKNSLLTELTRWGSYQDYFDKGIAFTAKVSVRSIKQTLGNK